ncbi:hypothetical protein [Mycobacterium sp. M23085]|uniref:hypothetical protein n=1 Tax=Mycobacterium sp. M23085 TaxID=3378087 RepID=UPI003878125C
MTVAAPRMLFIHQAHTLIGTAEEDFEELYRDEWLPRLGAGDDVRLAWYLRHPPVVGESFTAITIVAVRDGNAWEQLNARILGGDLATLEAETDTLRRRVVSKTLVPLAGWVHDMDFDTIPTTPGDHDPSLWIHDTLWPFEGKFDDYVTRCGEFTQRLKSYARAGHAYLEPMAGFSSAVGAGAGHEVCALSRINDPNAWLHTALHGLPEAGRDLGWGELTLRERWQTYLLNAPTWAPLW